MQVAQSAGRKGLVEPRHAAADRRALLDQVDPEARRREIERRLDAGNPAATYQHRSAKRWAVAVAIAIAANRPRDGLFDSCLHESPPRAAQSRLAITA